MEFEIKSYREIDSTNTQAQRMAREGAGEGLVVVSDKQTAGKGRRGRTWESPEGVNLYFSILLRPDISTKEAPMLTLVMAYSAAKVIKEELDLPVQIKWPNDLILDGKKICGMLTEMELGSEGISNVVVGVGINVNTRSFPEELKEKATSIYLVTGQETEREPLLNGILEEFGRQYEAFIRAGDLSGLVDAYNEMLVNRDREVLVLDPEGEYSARALSMNSVGELLVRRPDGKVEAIYAGEVSVRGVYGYV